MASHNTTPPRAQNASPVDEFDESDSTPIYQDWHEFNPSTQQWNQVDSASSRSAPHTSQQAIEYNTNFVLATWNIDAFAALPQPRVSGILSRLISLVPAPDIIFLQEVSRPALAFLLGDESVREAWISSEADSKNWGGASFATMTLLSKALFREGRVRIGPVWRVKFDSRFQRDALCCDIFVPSSNPASSSGEAGETLVRLINVHLDSLAIVPSLRPQQLSIVASSLRSVGRGLVAGDFNPVLPEDRTLVEENGLVDAWQELRQGEDGFTWGMGGKEPYPPGRLDKVALLGLVARDIEVMDPGAVVRPGARVGLGGLIEASEQEPQQEGYELAPWSDHSGLKCTLGLTRQYGYGRSAL
jgi:tyrosyl-DNA phosphodiesterase 2